MFKNKLNGDNAMKVKMADVARYLGISKATVSLAVNNKPGVNEETRQRIFRCIKEMEQAGTVLLPPAALHEKKEKRLIKVVIINHSQQVVCDPELDLWSQVFKTFDNEARKRGYLYGLTYLSERREEIDAVAEECNLDLVAGVIVFGTEMRTSDHAFLERIHKPLVLYDYELSDSRYSSVCIDNKGAVETALRLLTEAGALDIRYLSTGKSIYNFEKRREAYQNTLIGWERIPQKNHTVVLGNNIMEITEKALEWLNKNPLPDAFLCENYQVSVGMAAALRRSGIHLPKELYLAGIDEVPEYMLSGIPFIQLKVPHGERAEMAMDLLEKEISGLWEAKIKVFAGASVVMAGKDLPSDK